MAIRRLHGSDAPAARTLARGAVEGTPYAEAPLHALDRALAGGDDEAWALVAERDGGLAGVVLLGLVAGAVGAGRLQLVVVAEGARRAGVGSALLDAAAADAASQGARFLLAEVPEDPRLAAAHALLRVGGFRVESRIPDFVREGIGIAFLRRDLA